MPKDPLNTRMQSLRILQIVPSLERETGGPTRSVPALGKAFAELGHKVVLYTTTWPNYGSTDKRPLHHIINRGYEVVVFPAQRNPFFPNMPCSRALVQAVRAHCSEFDIVHMFSLWNPVETFTLRALRKSGAVYCLSPLGMLDPVVLHRNRWKKLPWRFLWERANIEKAALIHFTASLEEERAKGCWKLKRTIVVPHIVDLEQWKVLPDRLMIEDRFPQIHGQEVILFVGRINWVKNLDLLQSALVSVRRKRPKAMLMCVGPDNEGYQCVLEKQARQLGIENQVLFTGMLQGDGLKSAYARADAFALVSQKENFGHSAAEALACGIPVVLSNGVGIGSDLPASQAVIRVETNPEQIATALIRTLERRALLNLPDPDARSIATNYFGGFPAVQISEAYRSVLS
jgi:glycosyltransferase involved in cell wall biosynthesis